MNPQTQLKVRNRYLARMTAVAVAVVAVFALLGGNAAQAAVPKVGTSSLPSGGGVAGHGVSPSTVSHSSVNTESVSPPVSHPAAPVST